jgi:hypothetical protein
MGLPTNMNYLIPTVVLDNFFDDPLWVRDFALKQEYTKDPDGLYPGKRTQPLHELNEKLFKHVINRFNSIFFYLEHIEGWQARAFFQQIDSSYNEGWVHRDVDLISGLIYLNPNPSLDTGTTIYKPKATGLFGVNPMNKQSLPGSVREENNGEFDESIIVKNRFNRLIAFDSTEFHCANKFTGNSPETNRLTLVFFIERLQVPHFPIQRVNLI